MPTHAGTGRSEGAAVKELKPLSKERREEIGTLQVWLRTTNQMAAHAAITDVLAAEQYWRVAVRDIEPIHGGNDGESDYCLLCGTGYHKPNCPWLKAQEP